MFDVFQASDLHFKKSLSDQKGPLSKVPFIFFEVFLNVNEITFERRLLCVGKSPTANKAVDCSLNINPLTWFVLIGNVARNLRLLVLREDRVKLRERATIFGTG